MRAPLDMGGFEVRNVAPGSADNSVALLSQASVPIGTVLDFAGAVAPTNFLLCYGQAISRAVYTDLFAVIGTAYGSGDGISTFNIPDLRGRVSAGKDDMGGASANRLTGQPGGINGASIAAAGGSETHTLTLTQSPAHSHSGNTSGIGDHTHTATIGGSYGGNWPGSSGFEEGKGAPDWQATTMGGAGAHSHSLTTDSQGGGGAHNNVQPTLILNKIIKVAL